jgi:hypothetical protein
MKAEGEFKAVKGACASFKYARNGIYKLEDDLRSQFGLYKSSHRCRVGCYSVVYPMHLDHSACAEYCTSNAEMDGQSSWQDARW